MNKRERFSAMQASVLHLVDLKRAGYSPRFVELTVDPRSDRILAQPTAVTTPAAASEGDEGGGG